MLSELSIKTRSCHGGTGGGPAQHVGTEEAPHGGWRRGIGLDRQCGDSRWHFVGS